MMMKVDFIIILLLKYFILEPETKKLLYEVIDEFIS